VNFVFSQKTKKEEVPEEKMGSDVNVGSGNPGEKKKGVNSPFFCRTVGKKRKGILMWA